MSLLGWFGVMSRMHQYEEERNYYCDESSTASNDHGQAMESEAIDDGDFGPANSQIVQCRITREVDHSERVDGSRGIGCSESIEQWVLYHSRRGESTSTR